MTILKISDFCQKCGFWVFWEVTGDSGILEIRFSLFFGFLGGLKILAGGYGAVLVGVSIPPTQPCKEGARRSIFDDFENFRFLSKIWFLGILGGHWRLGDSGNFNFFDFGSISKFWFF